MPTSTVTQPRDAGSPVPQQVVYICTIQISERNSPFREITLVYSRAVYTTRPNSRSHVAPHVNPKIKLAHVSSFLESLSGPWMNGKKPRAREISWPVRGIFINPFGRIFSQERERERERGRDNKKKVERARLVKGDNYYVGQRSTRGRRSAREWVSRFYTYGKRMELWMNVYGRAAGRCGASELMGGHIFLMRRGGSVYYMGNIDSDFGCVRFEVQGVTVVFMGMGIGRVSWRCYGSHWRNFCFLSKRITDAIEKSRKVVLWDVGKFDMM